MNTGLRVYERALRTGSARLVREDGTSSTIPISDWTGVVSVADERLLARCTGPTLDVGCGPGRLTAELSRRGQVALGIDVSALAVAMTIARGGTALRRDVFTLVPGAGRWREVVLADGNVGIGGDPVRLLTRCRTLLATGGSVLLDLEPSGLSLRRGRVRLEVDEVRSGWFTWSWVGVDDVDEVAAAAGFVVRGMWSVEGRWQAELVGRTPWPEVSR